ncbi:MAG: TolC family protein [Thermoanaerobaculia bacterium]
MNSHRFVRTRGWFAGAALFCLMMAPFRPLAAESIEVSTTVGQAPGPAQLRIEGGEIHLTIEEAIRLAIERNLAIRAQQYSRERARLGIDAASGIYDFNLNAGASFAKDESPAASNLDGAEVSKTERTNLYVGGSQLLPTGGVAGITFGNGKFETNSQFSLLNPQFTSGLDLSLTQPLLRGFGRSATEYGIEVANLNSDISRQQFEAQLTSLVQRVSNAYWNLVAARYELVVAEESLALAKELHENNQVRVDVGTLAPLELVSSEAGIATREEAIIRARGVIGDAEDLLFFFLNVDQGDAWSLSIVPDTEAKMDAVDVDLDESIRTALAARPETATQELQIRTLELDQAFLKQDARPRLDLKAGYGLNGLGGDVLIRDANGNVIGTASGGWSDALDQVTGWDFPGWSIGLEFGMPLPNRTAKARAAIAGLALEEGKLAQSELELRITTEVRAAVRGIETAREQLESAEVSRRLAEKNLDAERRKYDNGLSTNFQILQIEEDLTAARSRLVTATTGYRQSLVSYYQAIGKLLENSSITIAD